LNLPSFTTIITSLGVIGIVIGLIALFSWAIENKVIGPHMQVFIGILVGLTLFFAGAKFYKEHSNWSIVSFGGAIFVEYLSLLYAMSAINLSSYVAFFGMIIFSVIGVILALKYDSLLLAHYSIIGGFIVPILTSTGSNNFYFLFAFLFALSIFILFVSSKKNWASIRLLSFFGILMYQAAAYTPFSSGLNKLDSITSLVYLILFFALYNLSTIAFATRQKKDMKGLDVFVLNLNSITFASFLVYLLRNTMGIRGLGGILALVSFVYLIEGNLIKKYMPYVMYSLIGAGIVLVNIALIMILKLSSYNYLIIFAFAQWALFGLMYRKSQIKMYAIFGISFLVMTIMWILFNLNIRFLPTEEGIFVLVFMLVILGSWIFAAVKLPDAEMYGLFAIILGFMYIYVIVTFVNQFYAGKVVTIIWSLAWLVYSLILYLEANKQAEKNKDFVKVKNIGIFFLGITLFKIAFNDLVLLSGGARIIGFMLFGLILLIGGYKLKK